MSEIEVKMLLPVKLDVDENLAVAFDSEGNAFLVDLSAGEAIKAIDHCRPVDPVSDIEDGSAESYDSM